MDRAFKSGASATPPTAPGVPSIGYATAGNPGGGIPATKPGEYWYHMITEELRAVVVAGGLTPAQGTLNQVLLAMQALFAPAGSVLTTASFTGSNQSLAASGYQRLPGGLIVQWGSVARTVAGDVTVTYPIAFPNAVFCAVSTPFFGSAIANLWKVSSAGLASMVLNSNNAGAGYFENWIVIGH